MNEAKEVTLSLGNRFKFSVEQCPKTKIEKDRMNKVPYANVLGQLCI